MSSSLPKKSLSSSESFLFSSWIGAVLRSFLRSNSSSLSLDSYPPSLFLPSPRSKSSLPSPRSLEPLEEMAENWACLLLSRGCKGMESKSSTASTILIFFCFAVWGYAFTSPAFLEDSGSVSSAPVSPISSSMSSKSIFEMCRV